MAIEEGSIWVTISLNTVLQQQWIMVIMILLIQLIRPSVLRAPLRVGIEK